MGQYYRIANLDKRETLDPFKFGSALKLTESCYVGDDYVDAITYLLANDWHGDRVLLCGDYAWSEEGGSAAGRLRVLAESDPFEASEGFLDRSGDFASVRGNEVYREIAPNLYGKVPVDGTFHIDAGHYRYVADETAGVFYDREKAPVVFVGEWEGEPYITRTDPLTLFMAIGNGLGGGDYIGEDAVNVGLVGSWAGHVITASDVPPVGLTEIECPFDENGVLLTAPDDEIRRAVEVNGLDWNHVSVADLAKAVERMSGQTGQTVPTVTLTEAVISPCDSPESTDEVARNLRAGGSSKRKELNGERVRSGQNGIAAHGCLSRPRAHGAERRGEHRHRHQLGSRSVPRARPRRARCGARFVTPA